MKRSIICILFFSCFHIAQADEELATYMSQLQVLTHKLNLSINANNVRLTHFYLHESMAKLEEIQNDVPEYEDLPIAVYLDRYGYPAYEDLKRTLKNEVSSEDQLHASMNKIIDGCNQCHKATKMGFIHITPSTHNPFNQIFKPGQVNE